MRLRIATILLLVPLSAPPSLRAQTTSTPTPAWYNGDRADPHIPAWSNWQLSSTNFLRVYDDFVVPDGGWTVSGVFSNNSLYNAPTVTQAFWEIRAFLSPAYSGTVVASGVSPATQSYNSSADDYRIEVDGLQVQLAPGQYWLCVTPVGLANQQSYISATHGTNATGNPPGNDGGALYYAPGHSFAPIVTTGVGGTSSDFSLGVFISGPAPDAVPPAPPLSHSQQWQADLNTITEQMPALYSPSFPGISLSEFKIKAASLYLRIPSISDAEIRTGIQALIASIEDPHTDVGWGPAPFRYLPLNFYWFDDGIYVTAASADYQNLLGTSLVSVGQSGIDDATARLTALVPHENDSWVKREIPFNKLTNTDFLFGTGITPDTTGAQIVAQTPAGDVVSVNVQALAPGQFTPLIQVYQGDLPLYRQHLDRNYWATVIDNGATVYFQYNSCNEDPKQPSADFFPQLAALMAQDGVQRVIVDMRNNPGGFVSILNPWIDQIKVSRFNVPGRLYVIVGRTTFSAAMYASDRFRQETAAIFVGEPTGGKPRFMNRAGAFSLPYNGVSVSYSNGIMPATDWSPTLMPDIVTGLTFQDYMNGADPALNAILSIPPPGN